MALLKQLVKNSRGCICNCSRLLWGSCLVVSGAVLTTGFASAQLVPDATLGNESSIVTPNVSINGLASDRIDGGATRGANLFHSFEQFNVGEGRGVYFSNPTGFERILTRVTGGNGSNILGTLGVLGNADLFFINPNGIIFGSNARLDLKGSFIGSTASSIKFASGLEFSATNPQAPPLLTINVPLGLQYGSNAGKIQVQGLGNQLILNPETGAFIRVEGKGLEVQPGQTLVLVGGEVALPGGNLTAQGGSVELGSVGEGLVTLTPTNPGWALSYQGVQNFQDILLSQAAVINTSGPTPGRIQVQGRRVTLTDGSAIEASNQGTGNGSNVAVTASELVEMSGTNPLNSNSTLLDSGTTSAGAGGGLFITTGRLRLRDGAQVLSATFSSGSAGDLNVNAWESVELIGISANGQFASGLYSSSTVGASGNAGNLIVNTGQLVVRDGARVSSETLGEGRGGYLTVNTSRSVELSGTTSDGFSGGLFTSTLGTGNAGNLTINTGQLIVRDGNQAVSATAGQGSAGNLSVNGSQSVELIGKSATDASGLLASAFKGDGAGGDLRISTPKLIVRDGAVVSVSNIDLSSRNQSSPGRGAAGNLQIEAGTIRLENQGTITAAAAGGEKGNITIESQDIQMRRGSAITTNATGASAGGSITIKTDTLVALENSDITANALNNRGGNVSINAQGIFGTEFRPQLTPNSDITATGAEGLNGVVQINTPDVDPSSGLVELPATVVDVEGLVARNFCAAKQAGSSFKVTGRGGLPASPNDPLTDEVLAVEWSRLGGEVLSGEVRRPQSTDNGQRRNRVIQQAQGWIVAADGTVMLTTEAPTATPQSPAFTYPSCVQPSSPG
ncbi:MAG: filamentous hemagglutinin N-terminal domain-containing protein [Coleofasciculus sp. C3-bin4]|nr:filamentous hemagglutinin N-terminal domain-containing protein [Coleofasciculus sp. C3-bin4]